VDLDTESILAAEIYHADYADTTTLEDSLHQAQIDQEAAGSEEEIKDAVADKGYHSNATLANLHQSSFHQ
jgi:transposase